ncbi:hypothetical protein AOLI_G00306330 [Acnodon oligacanthus]
MGRGDEKVHSHAQIKQLGLMFDSIWLPSGHAYLIIVLLGLREHMLAYAQFNFEAEGSTAYSVTSVGFIVGIFQHQQAALIPFCTIW